MINKGLIFLVLFLTSFAETTLVVDETPEEIAQKWTDQTRSYIIRTHVLESEENLNKFASGAINGLGIDTEKPLETQSITTNAFVAKDTNFRYVKKRRSNGMLCFDAITINGALYGTAEWFRTNGNYEKIGFYYNDIPCGDWTFYSTSNDIDSVVNLGNDSLLLKFEQEPFLMKHLVNSN